MSETLKELLGDDVQRWKRAAEHGTFFNFPIKDLDRDELLAVIGCLMRIETTLDSIIRGLTTPLFEKEEKEELLQKVK